jgi:hypothetical protein
MGRPNASARRRAKDPSASVVLAGYALISLLLFGLPVIKHPGRSYVGGLTTDPQVFIWSLAWWPHAIAHGQNPFVTKEIWVPDGVNLAWAQTAPALAIALWPVTAAAGPVVAYNLAVILMPALAAWTAFLLCRHITGAAWPSALGGYLFGFSTYMLGGTLAHVQTTAVFVVPLAALVVLQFFEGELGGRALAVRLGLLLALLGFLETEILFTTTLALASSLVLAAIFIPPARARLGSLAGPLVGAYAVAAVLLSPLLYYLAVGHSAGSAPGNDAFAGDALNFVLPTHVEAVGWWADRAARHFSGNDAERGTYIGLPALAMVALYARTRWRTGTGRFLLSAFVLAAVATLGSSLTFDGRQLFTLPWVHLAARPLFENVMPVRFSLYTALITGVIAALWLATSRVAAWARVGLPALAILSVVPNLGLAEWSGPGARTLFDPRPPTIPALFTGNGYRTCLRKHEIVLALPFGARGNSLVWQAKSDFWFRLAGGYIMNTVPPSFRQPHAVDTVASNKEPSLIKLTDVRAFIRKASVSSIVLNADQGAPWRGLLAPLGPPTAVGGVLIYRLDNPSAARCRGSSTS